MPTLPRSDAVVLAQPELLCDMLYNLIQNARKATPADGKVEVLLDETPTRLTIRVQDTGCGIPPQELARITEPFYMVDKSRAREQGGSGMGLALCARIAALHGTTLQFASVPSQGTTVSFCLQKRAANRRWSHEGKENVFFRLHCGWLLWLLHFLQRLWPCRCRFLPCWTVPPGTALRCSRMLKR